MPRTSVATRETTAQTDSLLPPPAPAPAPAPPERVVKMVTTRPSSFAVTMTPRAEQSAMKRESESRDAVDAENLPQLAASAAGVEEAGKGGV